MRRYSEVEFISGRGDREADGAALEKRSPIYLERGFESHPLRRGDAMDKDRVKKKCFVIMPFSETESCNKKELITI